MLVALTDDCIYNHRYTHRYSQEKYYELILKITHLVVCELIPDCFMKHKELNILCCSIKGTSIE